MTDQPRSPTPEGAVVDLGPIDTPVVATNPAPNADEPAPRSRRRGRRRQSRADQHERLALPLVVAVCEGEQPQRPIAAYHQQGAGERRGVQ